MALAFVGVLALRRVNLFAATEGRLGDDLMLLGAALLWAATTLTVKERAGIARIGRRRCSTSSACRRWLPPLSLAMGEPGVFAPTPMVWAISFQAAIVAGVSYLAWFWLVREHLATRLSSFSFLTPVMGVLAGGLILGEPSTRRRCSPRSSSSAAGSGWRTGRSVTGWPGCTPLCAGLAPWGGARGDRL